MPPLIPPALGWAGLGVQAASGLLSSLFSSNNQSKVIKFQREENALNREFNSAEAQKSRDFALDMFNRENAYNDPRSVVNRLQRAGINPALAYGGFADSASGSIPSGASSSGSISPGPVDYSGIQSAGNAVNNMRLMDAQIDLLKSEAEKNRKDTSWVDTLNQNLVDFRNSGIDLNFSTKNLNDNEIGRIQQVTENLKQELSNLKTLGEISKEHLKQAVSETHIKSVEAKYSESEHISNIKRTLSAAKLDDTQAWRIAAAFTQEMSVLQSQSRLNNSVADVHDFQTAINNGMKALKGIGGLSDMQIQRIENELYDIYERAQNYSKSRDTSERNTDALAFASILGSLIGAGTQVLKMNSGSSGTPHVGFRF